MNLRTFRALSLWSSSFFFLGAFLAFLGWFVLREFSIWDTSIAEDRASAAIFGIVACSFVAVSTLPELCMDLACCMDPSHRRPAGHIHGRYGRSAHPILNWLQTTLVLGGAVCLGLSMKRKWDDSTVYQSHFFRAKDYLMDSIALFRLSGCLFTLSGLIAVVSTGCCCCMCCMKQQQRVLSIVQVANAVYLSASLLLFLASFQLCNQCFWGFFLIALCFFEWCAVAGLWFLADLRLPTEDVEQPALPVHEEGGQAQDSDQC